MRIPLAFSESSNCGKRGHEKKMRKAKQEQEIQRRRPGIKYQEAMKSS